MTVTFILSNLVTFGNTRLDMTLQSRLQCSVLQIINKKKCTLIVAVPFPSTAFPSRILFSLTHIILLCALLDACRIKNPADFDSGNCQSRCSSLIRPISILQEINYLRKYVPKHRLL